MKDIVKLTGPLLLSGPEKTPPTEFCIWNFGQVETSKGSFGFDEDDASRVLATFRQQGNELMIDYDHLAVAPMLPGQGKAAGWFTPALRPDGLWATNVRWTPEAAKMLSQSEYRYFSPAFAYDKQGHIKGLLSLAITNQPATKNMEPLVAASAVPFHSAPVVDGAWDATAAEGRLRRWAGGPEKDDVDWSKYRKGFAWYDPQNAEDFGGYKLPHHDIVDGLVTSKRGVMAAAAVVQGGRGGADIDDVDAVKEHLAKHYHEWGDKAPWEHKETSMKTLSEKLKKLSKEALAKLGKDCELSDERLAKLAEGEDPTEAEMKKLSGFLGEDKPDAPPTPPEKKPEEELAREKASLELLSLMTLTGASSAEEARGTLLAWKRSHDQVVTLSKRLGDLERASSDRELDGIVTAALRDGKLTPAQKDWALEYGRASLPGLTKYLSVAMSFGGTGLTMPEPSSELAILTREELQLCKLMNDDPKEFAKHKLEMHKAGRA